MNKIKQHSNMNQNISVNIVRIPYETDVRKRIILFFRKVQFPLHSFEVAKLKDSMQKLFQTCQKLSRDSVHIIQTACDNIPLCVLCYKGWIMR